MIAELTPTEAALVGVCGVVAGLTLGFVLIAVGRWWRERRARREYERVLRRLTADFETASAAIGDGLTGPLRRVANAMEDFGKALAAGAIAERARDPEIVEALAALKRASTAGPGSRAAPDGDDDRES